MADGWKDYSIYPRTCSTCGNRVSMKKGATFSAKVKNGKIVETTSTCHACRALASELRQRCIYCGHDTRRRSAVCTHCSDLALAEAVP